MSDSEDEIEDRQLKIVLVGESSVGKTAIIKRFCCDEFTRDNTVTSGVDFFMKRVMLPDSNRVTLKICDVAGDALLGNMLDKYIFSSNIIIFVYDITNLESFKKLINWLQEVHKMVNQHTVLSIFGNKSDCEHQRAIRLDKIQQFCKDYNLEQFTVSARTGESVYISIMKLVTGVLGIKLSNIHQEQQNSMIKAEIEPRYTLPQLPEPKSKPKSSNICTLQ